MIAYLFKSIICLGILLLVYQLFLEKEKMHRFNRWYLLGSILFASLVPLLSFTVSEESLPVFQNNYFAFFNSNPVKDPKQNITAIIPSKESVVDYNLLLIILYSLITLVLLTRFTRNIYRLLANASKNKTISYRGASLVLLKEKTASYSFLHYIFISEQDYADKKIEEELITHELTHVKEKHSWDVIFIELLQAVCWFNPMLIFYKKAIQLNHEYLADEAVVKTYDDVHAYQYLLLDKASCTSPTHLTSNFNYSVTKKRLVMLTKTTNGKIAIFKKLSVIPILAATVFIFSSRIAAQEAVVLSANKDLPANKEGVSAQEIQDFNAIVQKNTFKSRRGHDSLSDVRGTERDRLETVFLKMNKEQRNEAKVFFEKRRVHKMSGKPSDAQFEAFKDPAKFGLWIDGKKTNNAVLDKYTASDFGDYWTSNLYYTEKMKQNVMKSFNLTTMYEKQLELTTKAKAEKSYNDAVANAKAHPYAMLFRLVNKPGQQVMIYVN